MSEYRYSKTNNLTFNEYLTKVFSIIAAGLAITAVVSFVLAIFMEYIVQALGGLFLIVMLGCCIGEIVIAIRLSSKLMELPRESCIKLFIGYAVLTGISLSTIVYSYAASTVWMAFGFTAFMFVVLTVIGNRTNINVSNYTGVFIAGLIAMMVIAILNFFVFRSALLDWTLCYVGIILFMVITVMDIQKLKYYYQEGLANGEVGNKLLIIGAFSLYLDFINLFIRILRLLGRRKD